MTEVTTPSTPEQENRRSKAITFTLTGHAHIDPVWLWDWREGQETVKATFRSALDRLKENPDMVFAHSSAAQYRWMEDDHPALLAEVREAVARGQWEPVGGWWVEPDVNLAGGEALARQALLGQRFYERALGRRARVAFLPDSFGHPGTLPQLFRLAGLEFFVFMRPSAGEIDLPSNLFWWEGPDGSRVLAARVECYNSNPRHVTSSLERNLAWRPAGEPEWLGLYGVGNHGGGPTKAAIASIRDHAASPDWPTLRLGALEGFFERAREREHPVFAAELQHHARGCYSAHSEVKHLNRLAEHALVGAEKWSSLAASLGHPYRQDGLERAWKHLLFNQFHDILAGSSVQSAYEDARNELGEAIGTAGRVQFSALQALASRVDTRREGQAVDEVVRHTRWDSSGWVADYGDGVPLVVFNPSPWPRREVVEVELNDWHQTDLRLLDHEGQPVAHQLGRSESASGGRPRVVWLAEVPALGYRVYRVMDQPALPGLGEGKGLSASAARLENRWWRLDLDPRSGALSSLLDKERGLELLAGPAAQLLVMNDPTDTWGHSMVGLREVVGVFTPSKVELLESGPVRATLAVWLSFGDSSARLELSLAQDTPAIHGRLVVDWHEKHRALKLAFPFALSDTTAAFEVPYGHATRLASGDEEPLQGWFDVTGGASNASVPYGVAILNNGKYAGDVRGGEARLTVLRSPVYAHHDPALLDPALEYRYQDQGRQETRFALLPHAGPWQDAGVVEASLDLNTPMPFVREYVHAGELPPEHGFLTVTPPGEVIVTALKKAESGDDLVLRLYEPHGRAARAEVSLELADARFTVEVGPHQIKTYRLSRGGVVREVNLLEEEVPGG